MRAVAYAAAACAAAVLLIDLAAYLWRWRALRTLPACNRPEPLALPHALVAFLAECGALALALASLPFRPSKSAIAHSKPHPPSQPQIRPAPAPSAPGGAIVLIHDYGLSAGPFWLLRRRLLRQGWNPVVCLGHGALEHDADRIAERLRTLVESVAALQPQQIVLLAHGYGGLVARLYAGGHVAATLRRLLTLGTPHRGSTLPQALGPWARAVAPASPLFARLQRHRLPREIEMIAVQSTFDATVLPPVNGEHPSAFNIKLRSTGHYGLLFSRKVFTLIQENLEAPLP